MLLRVQRHICYDLLADKCDASGQCECDVGAGSAGDVEADLSWARDAHYHIFVYRRREGRVSCCRLFIALLNIRINHCLLYYAQALWKRDARHVVRRHRRRRHRRRRNDQHNSVHGGARVFQCDDRLDRRSSSPSFPLLWGTLLVNLYYLNVETWCLSTNSWMYSIL